MILVFGKGEVGKGLSSLLSKLDIEYILMDDKDFDDKIITKSETIVCSPGISPKHKLYQKYGHKIMSELSFLGKLKQENTQLKKLFENIVSIGITGTNGKSTTTRIIYQTLKKLSEQKNNIFQTYITGNFKPALSLTLSEILDKKHQIPTFLVIETSAFMLYQIENWEFDYGVLTNIMIDHLDWYDNFEEYKKSKNNLESVSKFFLDIEKCFSKNGLKKISNPHFLGEYNQKNFNSALGIINKIIEKNKFKITENEVLEQMKSIKPLPHRLQFYQSLQGIDIYDDGICTSSAAQEQALKSFEEKVVLICGGAEKGDDFSHLDDLYLQKVGFAVCLGTNLATKFQKQFQRLNIPCIQTLNMKDCIYQSIDNAKKNNLTKILFSPGCASFDIFKNVYDRCSQFEKEVKNFVR